jgi:hypothetical protein
MFGRVSSADDMFCANGVVGAVEQGVFDEHFAIFASVVDVFPCFSAREGELVGSPTDNVAFTDSAIHFLETMGTSTHRIYRASL